MCGQRRCALIARHRLDVTTVPTPFTIANGTAAIALTGSSSQGNDFTYTGNQVLTTFGFTAHAIDTTNSGASVANLKAGIYSISATAVDGCTYEEVVAIPGDNAPQISIDEAATVLPTCHAGGNIRLSIADASSFGAGNLVMVLKGPVSSNNIVTPAVAATVGNSYKIDLNQFGALQPGNYAVLVMNVGTQKVGVLNLYLPYPDCSEQRKVLQTAYWAIEKIHNQCKTNIITPTTDANGNPISNMPANGISQFTAEVSSQQRSIDLQLCADIEVQAVASIPQMTATSAPIRISSGLDFSDNIFQPAVTIDILAHEYGHFLNARGVNINDNSPSSPTEKGAISEGFSDIIGLWAESYISPPLDWIIGNDLPISSSFTKRNIANPLSDGKPSIYQGANWSAANEIYTNSRVFSYWFYLLSEGGSQEVNGVTYTVPALGIETAGKITLAAFVNSLFGLNMDQNYMGLCRATTRAANALFPPVGGTCSPEVLAVRDAWRAVGLDCWGTITPALCAAACPDLPDPLLQPFLLVRV
ncbi:MAG: M4 family metallopeptidase [Sphingobacteriales bacterium]|nr:M4 family metallopeptidase [Sphingobacteriales bacterium]